MVTKLPYSFELTVYICFLSPPSSSSAGTKYNPARLVPSSWIFGLSVSFLVDLYFFFRSESIGTRTWEFVSHPPIKNNLCTCLFILQKFLLNFIYISAILWSHNDIYVYSNWLKLSPPLSYFTFLIALDSNCHIHIGPLVVPLYFII